MILGPLVGYYYISMRASIRNAILSFDGKDLDETDSSPFHLSRCKNQDRVPDSNQIV